MRILVVDDDELLRRSLTRLLTRSPATAIDEAAGVREAEALLARNEYDVVVSDEQMADGRGHALLAAAAGAQPRCRRVLMSAVAAPSAAGPPWEKFFEKPDGILALVEWIRALDRGGA